MCQLQTFLMALNFHLDEMAPLEKVTLKKYTLMLKPWITTEILKKCEESHEVLKLLKDESDPTMLLNLRKRSKNLQNVITVEKSCTEDIFQKKVCAHSNA